MTSKKGLFTLRSPLPLPIRLKPPIPPACFLVEKAVRFEATARILMDLF